MDTVIADGLESTLLLDFTVVFLALSIKIMNGRMPVYLYLASATGLLKLIDMNLKIHTGNVNRKC